MIIDINAEYKEEEVAQLPVEQLIAFALNYLEYPDNTEVSVSFVDNDQIQSLNAQYRGKDCPTDVLSFECDGVDDELFEEDAPVYELGDIVVAVDVAHKQTAEFGTTFEEEVSLLLVHGMLHLCGYDHIQDDEAAEMEALEDEILAAWKESRHA